MKSQTFSSFSSREGNEAHGDDYEGPGVQRRLQRRALSQGLGCPEADLSFRVGRREGEASLSGRRLCPVLALS